MKFHFAGKYSGNPDDIPHLEHEPGAVAFKEAPDSKSLGRLANRIAIIFRRSPGLMPVDQIKRKHFAHLMQQSVFHFQISTVIAPKEQRPDRV